MIKNIKKINDDNNLIQQEDVESRLTIVLTALYA
jgi:hypothetical protein